MTYIVSFKKFFNEFNDYFFTISLTGNLIIENSL